MEKEVLEKIGLSKAESVIYLSLLKLGNTSVRDISKDTGFHRTNIYDILEKLKEKGLASFSKKGKVIYYQATEPSNLYNLLNEKQEFLENLMPDLEKLKKRNKEKIEVSVFKGIEGMKTCYNDILNSKGEVYGMGMAGQLRQKMSYYGEQFLRNFKSKKRKYYGLYDKKENIIPGWDNLRLLPKEISVPVGTTIYEDKVLITLWESDLVAIKIQSKEVAETYKSHFNLLWNISKKLE